MANGPDRVVPKNDAARTMPLTREGIRAIFAVVGGAHTSVTSLLAELYGAPADEPGWGCNGSPSPGGQILSECASP